MDATLHPPPPGERRFIVTAVAVSVALHAAVLAFGPYLAHENPFEPPRVLSVVLADPTPAPPVEATPPSPPAARRPPPPTPAPARPAPPPRRAESPPPVPAASLAPRPARELVDAPSAERPPAERAPESTLVRQSAAAPQSAPAPAAAAAPREAVSPPDFRVAYLRNPSPAYPAAARRSGEEGTVMLRVLVGTEGAPREVVLERTSGSPALDAAALATVKNWRFLPARRGGEPQEAWVLVPIVFRLEPR
jgi:protein TonB